jgi:hypothetical protein
MIIADEIGCWLGSIIALAAAAFCVFLLLALSGCGPEMPLESAYDYHNRMERRDQVGREQYDKCMRNAALYERRRCEER